MPHSAVHLHTLLPIDVSLPLLHTTAIPLLSPHSIVATPHFPHLHVLTLPTRAKKVQKRLERRKQKEDLRRRLGVTPEQLPPPPPSRAEVRRERRKLREEKREEELSVKRDLDRRLAESLAWQPQSSLVGSMQRVEISDEDDDREATGVPRLVIKWFGVKTKRTSRPPE